MKASSDEKKCRKPLDFQPNLFMMTVMSFFSSPIVNRPKVLAALGEESACDRAMMAHRERQWVENLKPTHQPAALSTSGGLRGSKATTIWRRRGF